MATLKQIEANRLNAQLSTGPRTPEGKSTVRFNALKHGVYAESPIIIGEDDTAFVALRDAYFLQFEPAAPVEETLVSNLVRYAWILDRFSKVECHIWNFRLEQPYGNFPLVKAHINAYKELDGLQRRLNSAQRNFRCDLDLLLKLQAARKKAASAPEPILETESSQAVAPEIGFVPANPLPVNPAAPNPIRRRNVPTVPSSLPLAPTQLPPLPQSATPPFTVGYIG